MVAFPRVMYFDPLFTMRKGQPWAKSLYVELQARADEAAPTSMAERREKLESLPLVWLEGENSPPTLVVFPRENPFADGRGTQATAITKSLQDGIDCGVMFYLTDQDHYAECAADILFTFVNALPQIEPNKGYTINVSLWSLMKGKRRASDRGMLILQGDGFRLVSEPFEIPKKQKQPKVRGQQKRE